MKYVLIFVALISAPPAWSAECFLSTAECEVISREMLMSNIQEQRDRENFAFLKPYQREMKVIELKYARLRASTARLPKRVAAEMVRMNSCDVARQTSAMKGIEEQPRICTRGR